MDRSSFHRVSGKCATGYQPARAGWQTPWWKAYELIPDSNRALQERSCQQTSSGVKIWTTGPNLTKIFFDWIIHSGKEETNVLFNWLLLWTRNVQELSKATLCLMNWTRVGVCIWGDSGAECWVWLSQKVSDIERQCKGHLNRWPCPNSSFYKPTEQS